jgi:four helix bundle protein
MGQLPYVNNYKNLIAYQKARALAAAIFGVSKQFPREEMYSLTDQVRRSSRAVGANLAEAWAKRDYERHFVSKLTDADAEQLETQHWLEIARDCGYLDEQQARLLLNQTEEVGRLIGSMIAHSASFCAPKPIREPDPIYDFYSEVNDNDPLPTDLLAN